MYHNPYTDETFFSFFLLFFKRTYLFFTGQIPFGAIATDEIQVLVLAGVALSSSMVGTFLVLRRQTMLANALSHTLLLGIVLTFLIIKACSGEAPAIMGFSALVAASLLSALFTTFLTEALSGFLKLGQDASINLVFSTLFALGIVLVTLFSRNVHLGTELVMGNADALQRKDIGTVYCAFLINACIFACFFKEFVITTFDSGLARSFGISMLFFKALLMVQTSFTSVAAFRSVGVLMVLAFFVAPPLTARLFTHSLRPMIALSMLIGAFASLAGVALSRSIYTYYGFGVSTGGLIVLNLTLIYFISFLAKSLLSKFSIKKTRVPLGECSPPYP